MLDKYENISREDLIKLCRSLRSSNNNYKRSVVKYQHRLRLLHKAIKLFIQKYEYTKEDEFDK